MSEGNSTEERIRVRAYAIWQHEGEPEGRERDHWHEARRFVEGEDAEVTA